MKLQLITGLSILLLASCAESTDNEEPQSTKENLTTDTTSVENVEEEIIEETNTFQYFEDYLSLTNKEEIFETLGEENLEEGSSWYAEGTVEFKHIVYTNPENAQVIKFVMEEEDDSKVSMIEVHYNIVNENYEVESTQKVESSCGIYTGMKLADVVELNRAPLNFSGFAWDFAGSVMNMNGGELENCKTNFRLDLENWDDMPGELLGDMELNSDMDDVKAADIIIEEITLFKD